MKHRYTRMATLLLLALAAPASADLLIVLNKSDHQAALVDPADQRVLAKLATGRGPHEVAVTPDGRWAFVANYGMYAVFKDGERKDEPGNTLTVLDLEKRKVARTIPLGTYTKPHGIVTSRDGARVWVTCEGAQAVLEVDARTGKVARTWNTAQQVSHMVVATPDERKLYVANIGSGSVTIIERASGAVKSIATGAGAEGVDVSPDGREVWVTNRGANTISVLQTANDSIVATLESGGAMPIRAKFTPDGRQVWVSNARSNQVTVFDASTRERLGSIEVGAVPVGIQMEPSGRRAFVANTNDDKVTVLDVANRTVLATFAPGKEPDGMAWAPAVRGKR